jgi:hypothetical protein
VTLKPASSFAEFSAPQLPRMSDTPTFASLLTQWTGGGPAARADVYAHLRAHPAEAAALESFIRAELKAELVWKQVIAAEAMLEVYRDEGAAAAALTDVLRRDYFLTAADAIPVLKRLAPSRAGPLLTDFAARAPVVFRAQSSDFHRWAGATAARVGAGVWLALLCRASAEVESALLMGLADAAPQVDHALSALEPAVRLRLFHDGPGYAAGAALWRLTWRVHRDWLASINPHSPRFASDGPLLVLLIEVLTEHLGRRPALAPLVRDLVVRLGHDTPDHLPEVTKRLARLGWRGWSVLLSVLGDPAVTPAARALVFREANARPAVLPLTHHHAHAVVLARTDDQNSVSEDLLKAAIGALRALGARAGSALPDVLDLIVKQPDAARLLAPVVPALAPGFPNPGAAIARTLDRLRRSVEFAPGAFERVAAVLAALNLDAGPALVEDTSFDPRTPDLLLQQPAWKNAPAQVRRQHAGALADGLVSPRVEVRARAAELLRHYPDQAPAVWPALVAVLAGTDEQVVLLVIPLFRHLGPVADAVVPELTALFREPNPTYAARAVVALWRLGRLPVVTDDLRAAVLTATDDAWGWTVLRGVVDRVFQAHGLFRELSEVFAAAPQEVAAKIHALLNPPEAVEEAAITAHVPPPGAAAAAPGRSDVDWNGVYQCVGNDTGGGLLFLALMCAHGSAGFSAQKIWMIKCQRALTGSSLSDAKTAVERALERLTATAASADRRAAVHDFFGYSPGGPPKALTELLDHSLSWYRWAGLELLDAWGEEGRVGELIEDRLWDRSAIVRTRALRMHRGP